jgi:sterol desaturase/sphingolipid hydroxylase (fatty acid hydroxylase superfamily)
MTNWLLTHQATLQSYLILGAFACAAVWETFRPRRPFAMPLGMRWFNQIALTALGSLLARLCMPLAAFALAMLAQQEGWGLFNRVSVPAWLSLILGVVAVDLGGYVQHRLLHAVPLLWRFHQIHHSDLDVDCGTAIRHHPFEILVGKAFELALIAALGIAPLAVFLALTLGGIASVFNHANVALPTAVDRLLRWLVVTPDMHRIHHSADIGESNRNFANLFSWWDRLFLTYQRDSRRGPDEMTLGLAELRSASDVTLWKLLALPFLPRLAPAYAVIRSGRSRGMALARFETHSKEKA